MYLVALKKVHVTINIHIQRENGPESEPRWHSVSLNIVPAVFQARGLITWQIVDRRSSEVRRT